MKKKTVGILSALLVVMLLFTACNSGDGTGETTPTDGNTQTEPTTGGQTPTEGGGATPDVLLNNPAANGGNVFNYAQVAPPGIFNGILYTATYDGYVNSLVFDRLIEYEYGTMAFTEKMAESFTIDPEAGIIEFNLHKGIQIHDGYGELTAEDVAYTLRMICDAQYDGTHFAYYNNIKGAEAFKAGTADIIEGIVLHTAAPDNALPVTYDPADNDPYKITLYYDDFSMSNVHTFATYGYILPRAYYEKENYSDFAALNMQPVGTGPFAFNQYVIDQYVELDKFAGYWKTEPKVDKIIYHCIVNDSNIPALQNGTVDFAEIRNTDEDLGQLATNDGHLNVINTQGSTFAFLKFRMDNEIVGDLRVRQALAHGFDRALFVDTYTGGRSGLTYAMVPKNSPTYPDESLFNKYEYDPEKAGALLDDAGWLLGDDGWRYKDGQKLVITYTGIADNANDSMKTAMMVEDYKKIGVELIPSYYDWATYMDVVKGDDVMMYGYAWTMSSDPYTATTLLRKGTVNNDGLYDNPEFDRLVEEAKMEIDEVKANELYQQAYLLINEELPILFMNDYTSVWVHNNRVQGLLIDTFINWTYNMAYVEIVQP